MDIQQTKETEQSALDAAWERDVQIALKVFQHIFTPEQVIAAKGLYVKGWDACSFYHKAENARLEAELAAYKKFRHAFAKQVFEVAKNPVTGQFQVSLAKMSEAHDEMIDAIDKLKENESGRG